MSVENIVPIAIMPGVGGLLAVPIPSPFHMNSEIKVYKIDATVPAAVTETLLQEGVGYTISKTLIQGLRPAAYTGSVTTIANVTVAQKLVVFFQPANEQTTDFSQRPFSPAEYERADDLSAIRDASSSELIKRSPRFPLDYTDVQPVYDTPVDGTCYIWSAARKRFYVGPNITDIADAQENAAAAAASAAAAAAAVASIPATVLGVLAGLPNRPDGDITGLAVGDWFISGGYVARVQP